MNQLFMKQLLCIEKHLRCFWLFCASSSLGVDCSQSVPESNSNSDIHVFIRWNFTLIEDSGLFGTHGQITVAFLTNETSKGVENSVSFRS